MSNIIGSISLTPETPVQAESVLVEVIGPDGSSLLEATDAFVRINGVAGARQYLQFARAGEQAIHVVVERDGQTEHRRLTVPIAPVIDLGSSDEPRTGEALHELRAQVAALPILQMGSYPNQPYRVGFSLDGFRRFDRGLATGRVGKTAILGPHLAQAVAGEIADKPIARAVRTAVGISSTGISSKGISSKGTGTNIGKAPAATRLGGLGSSGLANSGVAELPTVMGARVPSRMVRVRDQLRRIPNAARLLKRRDGSVRGAFLIWKDQQAQSLQAPGRDTSRTIYEWDFGDGRKVSSYSARVDHDFTPSLDPTILNQLFDVSVTIRAPGEAARTVRRTLSVFNGYAMCRRRGVVVPPVEQKVFADTEAFGFRAAVQIRNLESAPIELTGRRFRVMSEDTEAADLLTALEAIEPIVIPANQSREIPVSVPFSVVPRRSMGFAIYLFGNTADDVPIRVEASFDVRAFDRASDAVRVGGIALGKLPMMKSIVGTLAEMTAPSTAIKPVKSTGDVSLTAHPAITATPTMGLASSSSLSTVVDLAGSSRLSDIDPAELERQVLGAGLNHLKRLADQALSGRQAFSARPVLPPVVGAECDPDNLPELSDEQLADGWSCQATPETREVVTPARFMNALKGDIVLSPGGNGLIGGLLRQVTPPQLYSHSGIMTRNYDQITHSTASQDRLLDHPKGSAFGEPAPTEGHDPDALKYLWPGVITQSVEEAVHGETLTDPDGVDYRVSGFSPSPAGASIDGNWQIVPPLVVKPDPLIETPALRMKLRQVANDALAQTGNSHYRFYCYTDPVIGTDGSGIAPPSAGWAAGTWPSVCSSFIWMALKRQGIELEGPNPTTAPSDLEPLDVAAGAQVDDDTPDGLYLYSTTERRVAAEWLHDELKKLVGERLEEKAGGFAGLIDLFSDMKSDVANQILNAFASDWAETAAKDSDAWRRTGPARAVSPDNILLWDSPQALGLYGYAAPVVYRPPRLEEVVIHRWRRVPTRGDLTGQVRLNGQPISGALVQVYDGKADYTDSEGRYRIEDIPFGSYSVSAYAADAGTTSGQATVPLVMSTENQQLDIALEPPEDAYRRVQVKASIATTDDEVFRDEHATTHHFQEVFVGPWHSHETIYFEQRMGGEIRIEVRFTVDINRDRSLSVRVNAKMYEGTRESTNDLDDEESMSFRVNKDATRTGTIRLFNDRDHFGGDVSDVSFTISNLVQN